MSPNGGFFLTTLLPQLPTFGLGNHVASVDFIFCQTTPGPFAFFDSLTPRVPRSKFCPDAITRLSQFSSTMPRTYQQELQFVERIDDYSFRIKKDFMPNMQVCFVSQQFRATIYF